MEREQLLELLKHMSLYPDRYLESGPEELTGFSGALASLLDDLEDDQAINEGIDKGNFYGLDRIVAERLRQVASMELGGEGYSPEHDMQYVNGELAVAAMRYTAAALPPDVSGSGLGCPLHPEASPLRDAWPWGETRWKPSGDPVKNLAKAGALIAAEMDRLAAKYPRNPVDAPQSTEKVEPSPASNDSEKEIARLRKMLATAKTVNIEFDVVPHNQRLELTVTAVGIDEQEMAKACLEAYQRVFKEALDGALHAQNQHLMRKLAEMRVVLNKAVGIRGYTTEIARSHRLMRPIETEHTAAALDRIADEAEAVLRDNQPDGDEEKIQAWKQSHEALEMTKVLSENGVPAQKQIEDLREKASHLFGVGLMLSMVIDEDKIDNQDVMKMAKEVLEQLAMWQERAEIAEWFLQQDEYRIKIRDGFFDVIARMKEHGGREAWVTVSGDGETFHKTVYDAVRFAKKLHDSRPRLS